MQRLVAGSQGRFSVVSDGHLIAPRNAELGLHSLYALKLQSKDAGWLVGDGGLILTTRNQGMGWPTPSAPLPEEVADIFNLREVCFRGKRGWIAGQPGSVIWHTPDGGQTWEPQPTGQTVPISAITFVTDAHGWAAQGAGDNSPYRRRRPDLVGGSRPRTPRRPTWHSTAAPSKSPSHWSPGSRGMKAIAVWWDCSARTWAPTAMRRSIWICVCRRP